MTAYVQSFTMNLVLEECYKCGIPFGLSKDFYQRCRDDSNISFYCPRGHSQHYTKSNLTIEREKNQRLASRIESQEATNQYLRSENRSLDYSRRAEKGKVTRIKNRIANGVCPCCNRSFKNVRRHMINKHPKFKEVK